MSVNKNQVINSTSTRADMLAHMGSLQQAAYVRPIEYQEGRAHGLKAIEVKNGPLRFVPAQNPCSAAALPESKQVTISLWSAV